MPPPQGGKNERRVDFVIGARDESKGVVEDAFARIRDQEKRLREEQKRTQDEARKDRLQSLRLEATSNLFAKAGASISAISKELSAGGPGGWGEFIEAIGTRLPFGIGELVKAGRDFRGMLDGTTQYVEKITKETDLQNKAIEARLVIQKTLVALDEKHLETMQKITRERQIQAAPPSDKQRLTIAAAGEDAVEAARRRFRDEQAAIRAAYEGRLTPDKEKIKQLQDAINAVAPDAQGKAGRAATAAARPGLAEAYRKAMSEYKHYVESFNRNQQEMDAALREHKYKFYEEDTQRLELTKDRQLDVQHQQQEQEREALEQHQAEMRRLRESTNEKILADQGKTHEAQLYALKRNLDEQLAASERAARELADRTGNDTQAEALRAERDAALRGAYGQSVKDARWAEFGRWHRDGTDHQAARQSGMASYIAWQLRPEMAFGAMNAAGSGLGFGLPQWDARARNQAIATAVAQGPGARMKLGVGAELDMAGGQSLAAKARERALLDPSSDPIVKVTEKSNTFLAKIEKATAETAKSVKDLNRRNPAVYSGSRN